MPGDGGLDRGDGSWRLSPGRGPARSAQLCPDTQIAMLSFISQCWVGPLIRGTPPPHQLGHNMTAVGACLCVRKFSRASEEQRGDTEPEK